MSGINLIRLQQLIAEGNTDKFYRWRVWQDVRRDVLKLDKCECQICKSKGRYRKGYIVHHVKHLRDRPDLALSIYDGNERQLITVCKDCHEELHPESKRQFAPASEPLTVERWD